MFNKKIWLLAAVLLTSFSIASSFNNNSASKFSSNQSNTPIIIGYSSWAGWWPWAIAESEGLFAKHNISDIELKWYDDYTRSMEDLASGQIDGNCQTFNDTIGFAKDAVKGEVVVLVNDNSAGNDKIIAAQGINRVLDLKGKQIAIEEGVVEDYLLTLALKQSDISRDDVRIINAETGAAVEAFAVGQVDAVGAFAPFWLTALNREGSREITSSANFPGAIADVLVVTQQLVDKSPTTVQALVDTWFDILDFMEKNPSKSEEIMMKRAGINRQQLRLFKAGTKMFDYKDNLEAFSKGNNMKHLSHAADSIISFLRQEFDSIEKKPDLSQIINPNFIKAHQPRKQSLKT